MTFEAVLVFFFFIRFLIALARRCDLLPAGSGLSSLFALRVAAVVSISLSLPADGGLPVSLA